MVAIRRLVRWSWFAAGLLTIRLFIVSFATVNDNMVPPVAELVMPCLKVPKPSCMVATGLDVNVPGPLSVIFETVATLSLNENANASNAVLAWNTRLSSSWTVKFRSVPFRGCRRSAG